jgi:uncharacterized protein (DUF433 family)
VIESAIGNDPLVTQMANVLIERITKRPETFGGKACISGHRIRVMDIVLWHENLGMTPDQIVVAYPELSLSDVHAALAYYFDNVDEIRNDIRHNDELADHFGAQFRSKLKEKLLHGAD